MADLYPSALARTCKDLEQQARLKASRDAKLGEFLRTQEAETRGRQEERRLACQRNALVLRSQMSFDLQRRLELRRLQRVPGIDPGFSGFPNIPETSSVVRRQKKRALQQEIKSMLDAQIHANHQRRLQAKELSLITELAINTRIQQEFETHKKLLSSKQLQQRTQLVRAYQDAEKVKSLQRSLDVSYSMMRTFDSQPEEMMQCPQEGDLQLTERPDSLNSSMSIEDFEPADPLVAVEIPTLPLPEPSRTLQKPISSSSLSVPGPTIQRYHPSDQRDNSLGGPRGRGFSRLPNIYVAPLRASGSEWTFTTCDQSRPLRLSRPTLVLKARQAS